MYPGRYGALYWEGHDAFMEAKIGNEGDSVVFRLWKYPTCHRRGPYQLLVEIRSQEHFNDWGCFDEQDQPLRNYHVLESALGEASAIAVVLYGDREKKSPLNKPLEFPIYF